MPTIQWGDPADRTFESGLDRGVLYLPDGTALPWNGLISVVENMSKDRETIYFDGMKVVDLITVGDYAATMRAVSYPPEFGELESMADLRRGVLLNDQPPEAFGLSYRTGVGSATQGVKGGHKLHVVYNLTAIPSDKNYSTQSDDPSLVEFEWALSAVPEEIPGFRPTAHLTFETSKIDPWLFEDIERILYGSPMVFPELPPMAELVEFIKNWARVTVVDNGDGTWTMTELRPGFIFPRNDGSDIVDMDHVNAVYTDLSNETYIIADTKEMPELLDIRVNGDGTWFAITDNDAMIEEIDGVFTLYDVEPLMTGPDIFRIKSKTSS